jgi:hypothetical protein
VRGKVLGEKKICPKNFGEWGGLKPNIHTNHLSENIFPTKGICTRFSRPKEVGGYIEEVALKVK